MAEEPTPKLRLAPFLLPEHYSLPQRPQGASPAVLDAHRQTQFLLAADLTLFERAMNLQLRIVAASQKNRTVKMAALLSLWSRVFAYLADASLLVHRGSYISCPPLVRTACDAIAAQRSLLSDAMDEYLQWAATIRHNRRYAALEIPLGRFRAGPILAKDQRLGDIYRLVTDLSLPHFGSTTLLVAPETNLQKMPIAFADNAFHLGWAELALGWLLALGYAQLTIALDDNQSFVITDEAKAEYEKLGQEIDTALQDARRCQVEELEGSRYLLHNFRRRSGAAPKKVLL